MIDITEIRENVEDDTKLDAPIVWVDTEGRDLCGECAENVEEASPDSIEYGQMFYNWEQYDHRCFICDTRFELKDGETFYEVRDM